MIDGPITEETTFELGWAFFEISRRHGEVLAFVLHSPGGLVSEASAIARDMRRIGKPVMILKGAICASACFLLMAAAPVKVISPAAMVGIHSAMTPGVGEDRDGLAATAEMAKEAAAYGVPDAIIGKMVRTPASGLSVLTPVEIRSIPGATVAQSVPYLTFTRNSVLVDEYRAGYGAGAYIVAGQSKYSACHFADKIFQQGCVKGFRDAPPPGWAR